MPICLVGKGSFVDSTSYKFVVAGGFSVLLLMIEVMPTISQSSS